MTEQITVEATIGASREKVWELFNTPSHIQEWNAASDDWHTPRAESDFRVGGEFKYRMEARDGSQGFDLVGTYDEIIPNEVVAFTMADGRMVRTTFTDEGGVTHVRQSFDPEDVNPIEFQRNGWQSTLDNFKKYVESQ